RAHRGLLPRGGARRALTRAVLLHAGGRLGDGAARVLLRARAARGLLEQTAQLRALRGLEAGEELVLRRGDPCLRRGEHLEPARGGHDAARAPVGRVEPALHETALLERV